MLAILLSLASRVAKAVETEKPGDYTILDANRHLKTILGELPVYDPATKTFTHHRPPSATLKRAVTNLDLEWQKLLHNSNLHDVPPPERAKVLQRCDDLKKHLTGSIKTKNTLKTERIKLEQRERFVESARKQVEFRNWTVFVGAMVNLGKAVFDSFKKIVSPSPEDVKKLYEALVKKMIKSARQSMIKSPGGKAIASADPVKLGENGNKYFVEKEAEIIKRVNDYITNRKFTKNELRNPKQIQREIFILIRNALRTLAVAERDIVRERIKIIAIELKKYTSTTLSSGAFSFVDGEHHQPIDPPARSPKRGQLSQSPNKTEANKLIRHIMMEVALDNAVRQGTVMLGDKMEIQEGSFIRRLSKNTVAIESPTSVGNPTSGTFQCGCKGGGDGCTLKQGANVLSCEKGEGSSCSNTCQFRTTIQVGPPGTLSR